MSVGRRQIAALGLIVLAASLSAATAGASAPEPAGSYIMKLDPGFDSSLLSGALADPEARITGTIDNLNVVEVQMTATRARAVRSMPGVAWVEPEPQAWTATVRKPNDPLLPVQWPLRKMGTFKGWAEEDGKDPQVLVAVIDTGVDPSHPDLRRNVVVGFDFVSGDDDAADDDGHGTHVAGIIAARPNNGRGMAGLSWGARILPLKACDEEGACGGFEVAEAIVYAVAREARVVNLSLGGTGTSCPEIYDLVGRFAAQRDTLLVAAAGNEGMNGNPVSYPAACDGYVGVGATNAKDERAQFSQFHDYVDLSAPGEAILSTIPPALGGMNDDPNTPGYGIASGTSMAAPHVSGMASLLLARHEGWSVEQVVQKMERSAVDLGQRGRDPQFGAGRISVVRALKGKT